MPMQLRADSMSDWMEMTSAMQSGSTMGAWGAGGERGGNFTTAALLLSIKLAVDVLVGASDCTRTSLCGCLQPAGMPSPFDDWRCMAMQVRA